MNVSVSGIFDHFKTQGLLTEQIGPDTVITGISGLSDYTGSDLVYLDNEKYLEAIKIRLPAAVVTTPKMAAELSKIDGLTILVAENVKLVSAHIGQRFNDRDLHHMEWPRVHPAAQIHESVKLPEDAVIGPGAVIGARAQIGSQSVVMANTVIENDVLIGERSVIRPNCVVGHHCRIGNDVILKAGCIVGEEGFGFAQDQDRHHHRIVQVGIVVIEDRVVMGANCSVDRATFDETRIKSGCIIDALCHIGHNVTLGEDCILVAQTGIAGSSRFGNRVIASGQTGVLDHVTVPDDTVLLHRAGVINSIKETGVYAATPPQPFKQYTKNMAVFRKLGEMWKRLRALEMKMEKFSSQK